MLTVPRGFIEALSNSLKELIIKIGPRDEKNEKHLSISGKPELGYDSEILYKIWGITGVINKYQALNKHVNQSVLHSVVFDGVQNKITSIVNAGDQRIALDSWKDIKLLDEEIKKLIASIIVTISDEKEWMVYVPLYDINIEADFDFADVKFITCTEEMALTLCGSPSDEGLLGALGKASLFKTWSHPIRLQNNTLLSMKLRGVHYGTSESNVVSKAEDVSILSLALLYVCFLFGRISSKTKYMGDNAYSPTLSMLLKCSGNIAEEVSLERISPFRETYDVDKKFIESKPYPFKLFEHFIMNVPMCFLKKLIIDSIDWFYDFLWEKNFSMRFIKLLIACEILLNVPPGQGQSMKFTDNAAILAGRDTEQRKAIAKEIGDILTTRGSIFHKGKKMPNDKDYEALRQLRIHYLRILIEVIQIAVEHPEYREDEKGYKDLFDSQKYGAWHPNRKFELPKTLLKAAKESNE